MARLGRARPHRPIITPAVLAAPSGAIAGTASLSFGADSSTLTGTGALAGSSALAFGAGTSTLAGAGSLAGASDLSFDDGSSILSGAGVLAGSSDVVFGAGSSTASGAGAMAGSSVLAFAGSGTLASLGTLAVNLISYWSLDEASGDAIDAHGTNDLTDTNTVGAAAGKVNGARDFEASATEYFTRASNAELTLGDEDFTLAGWVNFEEVATGGTLVGKWNDTSGKEYILYATGSRLRFVLSADGSAETILQANGFGDLSTATWYFVGARYDAANNLMRLRINASDETAVSHTGGASAAGTRAFRLGAYEEATPFPLDGLLDEWGLWDRHLTDGELADLYNGGTGRDYTYIAGASSGQITGSAALSFGAGTSALTGAGTLSGSADLVFDDGTSTLAGAGALAGSIAVAFTLSAPMVGTGVLAGAADLIFDDGASALTGTGTLSGSSAVAFTLSGTTLGTGSLAGASALVFDDGASVLAGAGVLSGTVALAFVASATFASDALAGTVSLSFTASGYSHRGRQPPHHHRHLGIPEPDGNVGSSRPDWYMGSADKYRNVGGVR